jgi:hypothetical protein
MKGGRFKTRAGRAVAGALAVLGAVLCGASAAKAQGAAGSERGSGWSFASLPAATAVNGGDRIVRQIDDPHTGRRWLLLRDEQHPEGPGRLVLAAGPAASGPRPAVATPAIRGGDRLVVEEHTARAEAWLEAEALAPAQAGSVLFVRLRIGGKVLRARAMGPGRAEFLAEAGGRP